MAKVIGIDVGGSTTKIVGLKENEIFGELLVRAGDPLVSIYGALGKFLAVNKLSFSDIEKIMLTGVGSSYLTENIYDVHTMKINEFSAIGRGGLFLSGLQKAVIVSMGTGTTFVIADKSGVKHIGGTGVGGGTLLGLSNAMLNMRDFENIIKLAEGGNLSNVDLSVGDMIEDITLPLPSYATVSNFGKISGMPAKGDMALGIINMVFQTIGVMAVFAARIYNVDDIVLTGNLINVPQAKDIFKLVADMFHVKFHMPLKAEFSTAVGAAISYDEE